MSEEGREGWRDFRLPQSLPAFLSGRVHRPGYLGFQQRWSASAWASGRLFVFLSTKIVHSIGKRRWEEEKREVTWSLALFSEGGVEPPPPGVEGFSAGKHTWGSLSSTEPPSMMAHHPNLNHPCFFLFPNQATCGRGGEEGVEARWEARQGKARKALHQRLESKPWLADSPEGRLRGQGRGRCLVWLLRPEAGTSRLLLVWNTWEMYVL